MDSCVITRVEMANYRSFYGMAAVDPGPGMNVIVGRDDTGKSGIASAITWCMHGKESGYYENTPIANTRYLQERPPGSECEVRVDVYLDVDDKKCRISGRLAGTRPESGLGGMTGARPGSGIRFRPDLA